MKIFLSSIEAGAQRPAMKMFLSAVEVSPDKKRVVAAVAAEKPLLWNLMSYYYLRSDYEWACKVRDFSELVMIDSGAHSFQKGTKVKWESFTREYAAFIKEYDRENVVGYFEMDVDNIIGYEKVLELRDILERESGVPEKIIPVWHKNRGIADFKEMCRARSGEVIAITGFKNEDIKDHQYAMFLKEAKRHGCKVHCLGMTRKSILDKVPFDYVDSSSWAQQAIYGRVGGGKVSKNQSKDDRDRVFIASYKEAMKMQVHYYNRWKSVCGD